MEIREVGALTGGDLRQLAEVEEISIGFTRPARRYRRLRANPDGEVGDGPHIHPVRARPVEDAATAAAVILRHVETGAAASTP